MSRVAKKADFITISIYSILAAAVIYVSAALGACVDLATNDEGKMDFDSLTGSLDSTLTDTKLVLSQVRAGGSAMKFPTFAAFGIGLYALMKITGKKKFHRKGEEHGSARWANPFWISRQSPRSRKRENPSPVTVPSLKRASLYGTTISFSPMM